MIVGVIGSGAIGPDLAYGFISALARDKGSRVLLHDISAEALERGMARIRGYVAKGVSRGKIAPKAAAAIEANLVATGALADLADCDYVLEAATERLGVKRAILRQLEDVVRPDCLIGFATSGLPRAQIAAEARHPDRCFVNHPFFPAWRALPIEVVPSPDAALSARMVATLERLGKVPILTSDVACFAADDVFCNYCSEAARIVAEGVATPAQVDKIVNDAVGGGGPFNVLDLTKGNLLTVHCQELMRDAPTGSPWFEPPALLTEVGDSPWHDRKAPGDPSHDDALGEVVLDRILAVLLARTFFVVDHGICEPADMNWLTRMALGFDKGLLEIAEDLGAERVKAVCEAYAADHPGFEVPPSIAAGRLPAVAKNVRYAVDADGIALVTVQRPEVKNALNALTITELGEAFDRAAADPAVKGLVVTGYGGALAGADIGELATIASAEAARALVLRGQGVIDRLSSMAKPTVAAVDGPVMGGGAEMVMACWARVVGKQLLLAQPEVNLGIVPGYGGTQRLPRLIGLERALPMLRAGVPIAAAEAVAWGWATGGPSDAPIAAAKALIHQHLAGEVALAPVDPAPLAVPAELPPLDIGHRSTRIDAILVQLLRVGLTLPLAAGLRLEAEAVASCTQTVDFDIGMKNFVQNGPRVPAAFLNE